MIALLETKTEKLSGIQRIRRRFKRESNIAFYEENVMGMRALRVVMKLSRDESSRALRKSVERVMEGLDRAYVDKVCFRQDFPMKSDVTENDFKELDDKTLWRIKAAEIAVKAVPKGEAVLLMTESVGKYEEAVLIKLCGNFRHVALLSDSGAASFCRHMCEKTGISIVEKPTENAVLRADAAVIFDVPEKTRLGDLCVAVADGTLPVGIYGNERYVENAGFIYTGKLRETIPEGYPPEPIISAAVENGLCGAEEISLGDIKISKKTREK